MSTPPPEPHSVYSQMATPSASPYTQRQFDLANNPMTLRAEWGIGQQAYLGAQDITGSGDPFSAVPQASSAADTFDAIRIYEHESGFFLEPDDPAFSSDAPAQGYQYQNLAATPMQGGAPVGLTEIPTSTTDPNRPRTVAAGYDSRRRCITVVFRDGTYYSYYEVLPLMWANFKRARSKGRFIYTYLDSHPRGPADVSALPEEAREALYRVVRTGQVLRQGITGKQSLSSKRGGRGTYRSGNLGGTGRSRNKRI